jgi:hypothetical protein
MFEFVSFPFLLVAAVGAFALFYFVGPESGKATSVPFDDTVPTLDGILAEHADDMKDAAAGYRGHCYRVYHFTKALHPGPLSADQLEQVAIAVAHHDIGVWSDRLSTGQRNIDYIEPSVKRAVVWLKKNNKPAEWVEPVSLLISEHHKLTAFRRPSSPALEKLVEAFRQADLVDFSLGLVRNGLSRALVSSVRAHWPNAGFHMGLVTLTLERIKTHPLNPFPMMKL